MKPCTKEDFEKFYTVEKRSASLFASYQANGGLFCIDWQKVNLELYGTWQFDSHYSAVDILVAPCGMEYTKEDGTIYSKEESECIWDKDAFDEYLGDTFLFKFFYNQESFQQASFLEDNRVMKQSKLATNMISSSKAVYIETYVNLQELIDEIALFQYGQQDVVEFYEITRRTPEFSGFTKWPSPNIYRTP